MPLLNLFKKNRTDIELMIQDTINYTVDQFKQSRTNFTVASAYGQIIFVLENIAQLILFYIEDSITELNINTATRANSVYGLAKLAGHNSTRAISSTGEIGLKLKPGAPLSDVTGGQIVLTNYTKIKCVNNGQNYLISLPTDDIRIPIDGSKEGVAFNIIQGQIETQIFRGSGTALQTFSVNFPQTGMVEHFYVNVYVNGRKWKQYDSLYDIPRNKEAYLVKTGLISGIDIYFGNTNFGLPPELGSEIRVEYLVSNGEAGNLNLTTDDEATWTWDDSGYTIFGDELDLNEIFSIKTVIPPDFGSNPEPLPLTKLIAPKTSRNFVLANPDQYIIFFEKFNQFSIIDAYQLKEDADTLNDKIIYLFLIPDVRKRMKSNENYFNIEESRFLLTDNQKTKILNLIERSGSKIVSTEIVLVDPEVSRFVINVAIIIYDDSNEDAIRRNIEQRLSDYFLTIRRRDRIPRSDLISIIESIDGVDSVNLSLISEIDERETLIVSTNARRSTPPEPPRIDEFGDILIESGELPIIRGGWTDRNGFQYESIVDPDKPSSLNIIVSKIIPRSYNTQVNSNNKSNLRT